jgi:hypothetical protein
MKTEAARSSNTEVLCNQYTRSHIQTDLNAQKQSYEKFKSRTSCN